MEALGDEIVESAAFQSAAARLRPLQATSIAPSPAKPNPAASMSPRLRGSARAGRPAPRGARCRPGPDRLPARPCRSTARPRHGPQSLADGFRPLFNRPRSPKGSSPVDGSLRPDEPPEALRPLDQRQALRRRKELAPGKAGRYRRGNCPGCGNAPIEACCKADGLVPYCGSSWAVLWVALYRGSRSR